MSQLSRRDWVKSVCAGAATYALAPALLGSSDKVVGIGSRGLGGVLRPRYPISTSPTERTILIEAGTFFMGTSQQEADALASTYGYHPSWLDGEVPQHLIHLSAFAIGEYPVTNEHFALFCAATGHSPPGHWIGGTPPPAILDHPVTRVNQDDAVAYAGWAGMRLPTEAEWEKAARGTNGRRFPWGNAFDPNACHWNEDSSSYGPGTAPVTAHPSGASPYGVQDMVGNVAEWCADLLSPSTAVLKGGAWITEQIINLRPAARNMSGWRNNHYAFCGFRCAKEVE